MERKVYGYKLIKSTQIRRGLDQFRKLYQELNEPEFLAIPYVLNAAAYLEARLNDELDSFASRTHGSDVSEAMKSMSLPAKLRTLVPLLTNGQYEINKNHFVYQRLAALIRVRNEIAHAKSVIKEYKVRGDEDLVPQLFGEPVPRALAYPDHDMTLGASADFTPLEYHEALDKLEKWFFLRQPDRLRMVAMVKKRDSDSDWQIAGQTFSKYL